MARFAVCAQRWLLAIAAAAGLWAGQAQAAPEIHCPGTVLPIRNGSGEVTPYVMLSLNGKTGPWLIDYGAGSTSIEEGVWSFTHTDPRLSVEPGRGRIFKSKGFSWPSWGDIEVVFDIFDRNFAPEGLGMQHGVVGVDLMANQTLEFHYEDPAQRMVVVGAWDADCDASRLRAKGFHRIGQAGHWVEGDAQPNGIYNGPVGYIELAEARAPDRRLGAAIWAQFDTGYEDAYLPFSIDINEAYFSKLQALGGLVEQAPIEVFGCKGTANRRRVFTAPGRVLRLETEAGARILQLSRFYFLLKNRNEGCGGIGEHDVPAAQLSAQFLRAFGTTIFMGATKEIWVRPARQASSSTSQ